MNKAPFVSITIPCYNYAHYVAKAINSVLEQSYDDLELIVVDNGSTDNSLEVIRSFSDPRLKVLTIEQNRGVLPAWRLGFESSQGTWLALLPADDFFLKDKIEKQARFLSEHPEIDVLATYIAAANADGSFHDGQNISIVDTCNEPWDVNDLRNWEWDHKLCMPSVLYHRKFCNEVANAAVGQRNVLDWEFHLRLMRRKAQFAVLPEKLTCYRWHGGNQSDPGHTGLASILLEWVYSYARAYIPLMKALGNTESRTRCVSKFINKFALEEQQPEDCAKFIAALLFPEEMLQYCPTFLDFKALSVRDASVPWMPEMEGLVEMLQMLKSRQAALLKGESVQDYLHAAEYHQRDAENLRKELKRLHEESDRRAAERDRAKQDLEKKRVELEKLRVRLERR